jgi:SAM-dependent methyltransferase
VLAELVGPSGQVVGVDFAEAGVDRARSVIAELGLDNVDVRVGDVNSPDLGALVAGPVDLAFTRCFLMHQGDPAQTLARIAEIVRPGGWIVAHEPMRSPSPRAHPHVDALGTYWEVMLKVMEAAGASPRTVDDLPAAARAAGLEIVRLSGFFVTLEPAVGFELHAASAVAIKDRAVKAGIATATDIDDLAGELRAASREPYGWVTSPFYLDLAARKAGDEPLASDRVARARRLAVA